jgi:hypothetical protein
MRVLIACEFSGVVREAFSGMGHDAWSCDLLPSEIPGQHYQGDVHDILHDGWDLMIAHPPCTYLCLSGIHWNNRIPGRREKTAEALRFVGTLLNARIPRIALENPAGVISTHWRTPEQKVQPWQFGDPYSKLTHLWLKGLPQLVHTRVLKPEAYQDNGKPRWRNQTATGQNNLGPSKDRWALRSITYPGIAVAMATQWGALGA